MKNSKKCPKCEVALEEVAESGDWWYQCPECDYTLEIEKGDLIPVKELWGHLLEVNSL